MALPLQRHDATRGAHQHVHAAVEGGDLAAHVDAAEGEADAEAGPDLVKLGADLPRQLAGGADDKDLRRGADGALAAEGVREGDGEGEGLAGPRRRLAHQVAAVLHGGQRRHLHGEQLVDAGLAQHGDDALVEGQLVQRAAVGVVGTVANDVGHQRAGGALRGRGARVIVKIGLVDARIRCVGAEQLGLERRRLCAHGHCGTALPAALPPARAA